MFGSTGWRRVAYDPRLAQWAKRARHIAIGVAQDPKMKANWLVCGSWFERNRRSLVRVHTLLNSLDRAPQKLRATTEDLTDLNSYGLGEQRTLHEYQQWAGVDFSKAEISEWSKRAQFDKTHP